MRAALIVGPSLDDVAGDWLDGWERSIWRKSAQVDDSALGGGEEVWFERGGRSGDGGHAGSDVELELYSWHVDEVAAGD